MEYQPQWPYQPAIPEAAATIAPPRRRERDKWVQLAPYFVACTAVSVAVTVLLLFLIWRTGMQAQVDLLRHQVAATQAQLSAAADSGQSQISGLSRDVKGLRRDVDAVSGLASFKGECTADASGPSGVAVYMLPCRR